MYQAFNVKSLNGFPVKQFVKCCNFLVCFWYLIRYGSRLSIFSKAQILFCIIFIWKAIQSVFLTYFLLNLCCLLSFLASCCWWCETQFYTSTSETAQSNYNPSGSYDLVPTHFFQIIVQEFKSYNVVPQQFFLNLRIALFVSLTPDSRRRDIWCVALLISHKSQFMKNWGSNNHSGLKEPTE